MDVRRLHSGGTHSLSIESSLEGIAMSLILHHPPGEIDTLRLGMLYARPTVRGLERQARSRSHLHMDGWDAFQRFHRLGLVVLAPFIHPA